MTQATAPPATPPTPRARPATPAQLAWLRSELALWRSAGWVDDPGAAAIIAGYRESRRLDLARLLLTLGAAFVGIGVLWLVASNLDRLSPLSRFGVVTALWLACLAGAELLAGRRAHGGAIPSPVVGAVRVTAALAFGAVVMQAAQSLQVPAYSPGLLAWWSLGALVHAYAVRGVGPLVVGLLGLAGWVVWQAGWDRPSALGMLLAVFAAGVVAAAVAAGHAALHVRLMTHRMSGFAAVWREVGAALSLGALFVSALPFVTAGDFAWTPFVVATLVVAGTAAAAAVSLAPGGLRLEPAIAVAVAAVGVLLVCWDAGSHADTVGAADWAPAAVGVVGYVGAAAWVAVLGVLRDSPRLTFLATAALVVFTTVQSFAVFGAIVQGAWLFVLLGVIFVGTGWVADRARRELAKSLVDTDAEKGVQR